MRDFIHRVLKGVLRVVTPERFDIVVLSIILIAVIGMIVVIAN